MEFKLRWVKSSVLDTNGNDNTDADPNYIIFTIKDTKLCVPIVTLSAKYNQNFLKHLIKTS